MRGVNWRVRRTGTALFGIGLLGLTLPFGTATAADLAPNQCAIGMAWQTTQRAPALGNMYAAFSAMPFKGSEQTPLDSVAFVIRQRFPAAAYGGWFLYPESYEFASGGVTFPDVTADAGSVNPYTEGVRIFAPNRAYTVLATADSIDQATLPGSLKDIANRITWPQADPAVSLMQRSYGGKAGFDKGGTGGPLDIDWADVRTFDVKTGNPVNCATVQPLRDRLQKFTPWNTKGAPGVDRLPTSIGGLFPSLRPGRDSFTPKPNRRLVQFFRNPPSSTGWPGSSVPPPPPDGCANYISANLNVKDIALIRVPKVPSFQPTDPPANATYKQTDTGFYVWQIMGRSRQDFNPGSPFNPTLANEDLKQDATGGITIVVWPRTLSPTQRRAVFRKARRSGWNLLEGSTNSIVYHNSIWLRVNGPSKTYTGALYPNESRSGVPCHLGPQSVLDAYPATASLTTLPDAPWNSLGAQWAAVPSMLGSATPQGVQCNVRSYRRTGCLRRLKRHIASTGGSFTVR